MQVSPSFLSISFGKKQLFKTLGLILCKLSKDVPKGVTQQTERPVFKPESHQEPEVPEVDESFFNEDLMSAVLNGHIETAKELIEDGSDVNAEDVHGRSFMFKLDGLF